MEEARQQCQENIKELLLEDYRYAQESFWKNEAIGETRVNFFITIATAVIAALVALFSNYFEDGAVLSGIPIFVFYVALFALVALLFLGGVTLYRLLKRNEVTDGYKKDMDEIRQRFKDYFDEQNILSYYYPFTGPSRKNSKKAKEKLKNIQNRKFGGLAHLIAFFNSIITTAVVAILLREAGPGIIALSSILVFFSSVFLQFFLIKRRQANANRRLCLNKVTHAGGVVYSEGKFLVISSLDNFDCVFPKGHIENGEGHKEAAIREVKEETGIITSKSLYPLGIFQFTINGEIIRCKYYLMIKIGEISCAERRKKNWLNYHDAKQKLRFPETLELLELARHHVENLKL